MYINKRSFKKKGMTKNYWIGHRLKEASYTPDDIVIITLSIKKITLLIKLLLYELDYYSMN